MKIFLPVFIISFSFSPAIFSCNSGSVLNNQLTDKEKSEGWELLFDGVTSDGWHVYNGSKTTTAWLVKNGELYCSPEDTAAPADLLTDKEFENFDLHFDWKISKGGNSGVFINVVEKPEYPRAWTTGPEYQLLDSAHHDFDQLKKRSGCLYGFAPQKNPAAQASAGQWNKGRILQQNGKIEFYVNDVLTAIEDFKSQAWTDSVANSGFKNFPQYSKSTKGHIALQDWLNGVSFRNIKIKNL
ncbi:DUF1080 domain-containing protein [Pollutibacter soli]|uniref:3-keto-disaccharide hydrolase n=1 Tax=Pollutibacter soli TaxID=3034157 RepID=UPI003013F655